jgi:hypothetical protein
MLPVLSLLMLCSLLLHLLIEDATGAGQQMATLGCIPIKGFPQSTAKTFLSLNKQ